MPTTDWNSQVKTGSNLYPIDRPVSGAITTTPIKTPTVLTDATFREDTKPKLDARLNSLIGVQTAKTNAEQQGSESDFWSESGETRYSEDPAQNALLTSMRQNIDEQTGQMLDAITSQFNVRRSQQEEINRRATQSRDRSLLLAGTSRYAPLTATGISHATESYGLSQLADLDAQERTEIAKARQYQLDKQYDLMDKALTNAESLRKEKQAQATKIAETVAAENKRVRDAEMRATRDSAIAGLLQQGITDPAKLLQTLNYDEKGNMIGDFTAKEITDTLKGFNDAIKESAAEKGFKLTPSDYTTLLGSGLSMPDIDAAMSVIQTKGYNALLPALTPEERKVFDTVFLGKDAASKAQGLAGGMAGFDRESDINLAFQVLPTQIKNSDKEGDYYKELIRNGLDAGLSPWAVADELMGYKIDNPDAFSEGLRQYFGLDTIGITPRQVTEIARLVNQGQNDKAISIVENTVYNQAKSKLGDDYMSEAGAVFSQKKADEIESLIESLGEDSPIGIATGSMSKWLGRAKSKEATQVQAKVASLVAKMRNDIAGTAVTDSEKEFLYDLIPDINTTPANFMARLTELRTNPLVKLNATRSAYSLPELNREQLMDRKKRIPLYEIGEATMRKVNDPDGIFEGIEESDNSNPGGI